MVIRTSTATHEYDVIREDMLAESVKDKVEGDSLANTRSFIRHDADKLAGAIFRLIA